MATANHFVCFVLIALLANVVNCGYLLKVKSDTPAVKGSVVHFTADLYESNGARVKLGDITYKWDWWINDYEKKELRTSVPHVEFNYTFSNRIESALNKIDVTVGQWYYLFSYPMASTTLMVNITNDLNGQLQLKQSGARLLDESIARNTPVEQEIVLRDGDYASISSASEVIVHWFVDCVYVQRSKELNSVYSFADANRTHQIEALVEITPETEPAQDIPALKSRLISDWQTTHQPRLPFVCNNNSAIAGDPHKIYGHFSKNVTVFDPITNLTVIAPAWVNLRDQFTINIACNGSKQFEYCVEFMSSSYEAMGNETCNTWTMLDQCDHNATLVYTIPDEIAFALLVVVRNAVSIERQIVYVRVRQSVILVAAVVGIFVFALCLIMALVCCVLVCCRKRKRNINRKPTNIEVESSLLGMDSIKIAETKSRINNNNEL